MSDEQNLTNENENENDLENENTNDNVISKDKAQQAIKRRLSKEQKKHEREKQELLDLIDELRSKNNEDYTSKKSAPASSSIDIKELGNVIGQSMSAAAQQRREEEKKAAEEAEYNKRINLIAELEKGDPELTKMAMDANKNGTKNMDTIKNVAYDLVGRFTDKNKISSILKLIFQNENAYNNMRLAILDNNYEGWLKNVAEKDNPPAHSTMPTIPDLQKNNTFSTNKKGLDAYAQAIHNHLNKR